MKKVTESTRRKLEAAMCVLFDNEQVIVDTLATFGEHENSFRNVGRALRLLVDGE